MQKRISVDLLVGYLSRYPLRFFGSIALLLALAGCGNIRKEHLAILEGQIVNAPAMVLLQRLDSLPVTVDTLKLSPNGNFECHRKGLQSDFYRLKIGTQEINLILHPDTTTVIRFDYFNVENTLSLTGFNQSAVLQSVEKNSRLFEKHLALLSDTIKKLVGTNVADSIVDLIYRQQDTLLIDYRGRLESIVKGNEGNLVIIPALLQQAGNVSLYAFPKDKQLFIETQFILSQKYPHSYQVRRFSNLANDVFAKLDGAKRISIGDKLADADVFTPWNERLALSSLLGKNVMVVIWSSQLPACRARNQEISKLMWRYRNQGLETYMISLDSQANQWKAAIKEDDLNCLHVSDLAGQSSAVIGLYGIDQLPALFLLNSEGKIVAKNIWGDKLEDAIQHLGKTKK